MNLTPSEIIFDKKGRYVYFNHNKQRAFEIPEKNLKKYNAFHHRFILALALAIMLPAAFELEMYWGLVIFVVAYIGLSIYFYTKMLPNLNEIPNYDYAKSVRPATNEGSSVSKVKIALYSVIGIMLVYMGFTNKYEPINLVIVILFAIFSFGMAGKTILDLRRSSK